MEDARAFLAHQEMRAVPSTARMCANHNNNNNNNRDIITLNFSPSSQSPIVEIPEGARLLCSVMLAS